MENKRGGARSGAGRKKGEPTARISVPVSMVSQIKDLIKKRKRVKTFIDDAKKLLSDSTPKSTDDPLNGRD